MINTRSPKTKQIIKISSKYNKKMKTQQILS